MVSLPRIVLCALAILLIGFSSIVSATEITGQMKNFVKSGEYPGFGYEWENNSLGISEEVPAPFTPVDVDGHTVFVWGRQIEYGRGWFPQQIYSKGESLLAAPIRADLIVSGKPVTLPEGFFVPERISDERAEASTEIDMEGLRISADVSVEFDGFIRTDLVLLPPEGGVQLDRLVLEIPYTTSVGKFFSTGYDYDYVAQKQAGRDSVDQTAGRIEDGKSFQFNSNIFVGNEHVGMELILESDYEWSLRDFEKAVTIAFEDGKVLLRVNMVDRPRKLEQKTRFSFALLPTPARPKSTEFRRTLTANRLPIVDEVLSIYDRDKWNITTMRAGPVKNNFVLRSPGLPLPISDDDDEYRAIEKQIIERNPRVGEWEEVMNAYKEKGVGVIPYSATFLKYFNLPEFFDYYPGWLMSPDNKGMRTSSDWELPVTRTLPQTDFSQFAVNLYSKSIRDFMIWQHVKAARECGYAGLYLDVADITWNHDNPLAGDYWGRKDRYYKPVYQIRDFYKRLYKAVKKVNPDYLVTGHHGKMPAMFAPWFDTVFTGEGINAQFKALGEEAYARGEFAIPYLPDYSLLDDDYWMAVYAPNVGTGNIIIPMVLKWNPVWNRHNPTLVDGEPMTEARMRAWFAEHPEQFEKFTRGMFARTLILDLGVVRYRCDLGTFDRLLSGIQNQFGGFNGDLEYIPFHESDRIFEEVLPERCHAVAFKREDQQKAMVVVANWSDEPVKNLSLTVRAPELGLAEAEQRQIVDVENGEIESDHNRLAISIPPNDFRVLVIGQSPEVSPHEQQ